MDKDPMPKIVSANRLADGIVVYRSADGAWLAALGDARTFTDEAEATAALAAAREDARRNLVVEPFLVEVEPGAEGFCPTTLRNAIRARGPTIDYAHFAGFDRIGPSDREGPARDR